MSYTPQRQAQFQKKIAKSSPTGACDREAGTGLANDGRHEYTTNKTYAESPVDPSGTGGHGGPHHPQRTTQRRDHCRHDQLPASAVGGVFHGRRVVVG